MQKFNFYDIYGYLIPGGTLLALLWLPFAASVPQWPAVSAWAGAVVAAMSIAAAYIAGHLVQTFATGAMPSSVRPNEDSSKDSDTARRSACKALWQATCKVLRRPTWETRRQEACSTLRQATHKAPRRKPSSVQLDNDGSAFVTRIHDLVKESFQLDVSRKQGEEIGQTDKRREKAFLLCRAAIVEANATSYVEQFEGMYTLMRGLTLSFYLGAAYAAGWALEPLRWKHSEAIASAAAILLAAWGIFASLAAAPVRGRYVPPEQSGPLDMCAVVSVGAALLAAGYCLALAGKSSLPQEVYLPIALIALLCGIRCFTSYHRFAWDYASEVWRAFVAHQDSKPGLRGSYF